ncbi:SidA/IucD/PvdA family monooxygenase [Nocardioides perillae]|uniref:L-lysine N6-monooxygenase MbtG n=1 Tax=Nocardioides perillae TaxID=1119534 RepID=A0A7Y9UV65_9ACTN|nr:lysine N6-hydroxylase [Nocardioides perillae]
MSAGVHDVVGVGVGPFNLGLACLAEPLPDLDCVFLEARGELAWHPGMLLEESTLQVPFLADLVTMADPTSPFSFLAFLKDTGRLYPFYVRESFYPLRREYDAYCRWAAGRLTSLRFHQRAEEVRHEVDGAGDTTYVVRAVDPRDGSVTEHRGRHLVLGVGTVPHVPAPLAAAAGPSWHSADYLAAREQLLTHDDVTVVGSGQSAAEVVSDLLVRMRPEAQLRWLTRSPRFYPMEYTKLTLELTSPEHSAHVRSLPPGRRRALLASHAPLHKGISADLVDRLHEQLYVRSLDVAAGRATAPLLVAATEVTGLEPTATGGHRLSLQQTESGQRWSTTTDALLLATGYRYEVPAFLAPVADRLRWDSEGRYDVADDFTVDDEHRVFVQNAELHTHGINAPDLGMGPWRSSVILERVLGHAPYPVEQRVAFQEFGVPACAEPAPAPSGVVA